MDSNNSSSVENLQAELARAQESKQLLEAELANLRREFKKRTDALEQELITRGAIEKRLDKQRAFLRQVIDLNPNFIFAKNRDCKFTLVNKAVAEAYGTSTEDLLGKGDCDFNSNPEEVEHFRKDDLAVMNTKQERIIPEEVITDAAGKLRWLSTVKRPILDDSGYATHVLGVASDITEVKLNEQELAQLAAIVESTSDAIVSASIEGKITSWNTAAEETFGLSASEAIGQHISLIYSQEFLEDTTGHDPTDSMFTGIKGLQIPYTRKDGSRIHLSLTISPIFDRKGNISGTSAICRDVTQRVRTELELQAHRERLAQLVDEKTRELAKSQERLRSAERLAAMGALASGIAHEINNPIGAILLTNENALEQLSELRDDPREAYRVFRRTAKKTINNAHRCAMIIKDALQFAKKKDTRKWPSQLNPIVITATQLLKQFIASKNARIKLNFGNKLPDVVINPLEIEQVLVNLIKNAIESATTDPLVEITTSRVESGGVLLEIKDNGMGIPEDVRKRVFEAFYTTRSAQGGTGLGLNIVKEIIKGHQGEIDLQSTPGLGTKFSITLKT